MSLSTNYSCPTSARTERGSLLLLLALSLGYYLFAIDWGLPNLETWAPDELVPGLFRSGYQTLFAGGWHTQYPPFHFFIILIFYWPLLLLGYDSDLALGLVGRGLSVAMGVGSVYFLYRISRTLLSHWWALAAAALFGFSPQMVYYAKIANLDVPYLFWLLASLLVFSRILSSHRCGDYLLFAVLATAAICTKQQAYAFYVLLVPLLFYQRIGRFGLRKGLFDWPLVYAALLALLCFVVFQNLIWGYDSFVAHLKLITGPKFAGYKMFPQTLLGQGRLLALSIEQVAVVTGIPLFICGLVGAILILKGQRAAHWLILSALSYQIFFIHVAFYAYDRFFIPIAAIMAILAAYALYSFSTRAPALIATITAGLIIFQLARATEVNLLLHSDSRYEAESWMAANVPSDRRIGLFGYRRYLPRTNQYQHRRAVSFWPGAFAEMRPQIDCLVMLHTPARDLSRNHPTKRFMAGIRSGEFGLVEIFRTEKRRIGTLAFNPSRFLTRPQRAFSNLAKISPAVRVYSVDGRCQQG